MADAVKLRCRNTIRRGVRVSVDADYFDEDNVNKERYYGMVITVLEDGVRVKWEIDNAISVVDNLDFRIEDVEKLNFQELAPVSDIDSDVDFNKNTSTSIEPHILTDINEQTSSVCAAKTHVLYDTVDAGKGKERKRKTKLGNGKQLKKSRTETFRKFSLGDTEEVQLYKDMVLVGKGQITDNNSLDKTVHGVMMSDDDVRIKITHVYNIEKAGLDSDKFSIGSFVMWKKNEVALESVESKIDSEFEDNTCIEEIYIDSKVDNTDEVDGEEIFFLMKNGLKIAEGELKDNENKKSKKKELLKNEESLVLILKIFPENMKKTSAPKMAIGKCYTWPKKGLTKIDIVTYNKNEMVRLFRNNLQIGIGSLESGYKGSNDGKVRIKVSELLSQENFKQSDFDNICKVDETIFWPLKDIERYSDLPKKKKLNPSMWKKNREKIKKLHGLEYEDYKGKVHAKKLVDTTCSDTASDEIKTCDDSCRRKCTSHISKEQQIATRNAFFACDSYEMQNINLAHNLEQEKKKSTKVLDVEMGVHQKQKAYSVKYYLPNEKNEKVLVCKNMFLRTFGISDKRKQIVVGKKYSEELCNIKYQHKLKSKRAHNKFSDEIVDEVKSFIKKIPSVPSHYRRKDSKKYYFEMGLNYKKLYNIYKNDTSFTKHVSLQSFKNILNEFNVGFHRMQKDQCSTCRRYKNSEKTVEVEESQELHLRRKDLSRVEKENDKKRAQTDNTFTAVIGDMAQVAPCPRAESSEFFYISKLSCYNYSLYNLGNNDGTCYHWDQTKAKRGAIEITSGMYNYLTNLSPDVTEVVIWSDTCGGQNRNHMFSSMLVSIVNDPRNNITKITQKYFESGHSQSEVDTIHSSIETASTNTEIYMPDEWLNITRMARQKHPYKVIRLGEDSAPIYDFKEYSAKRMRNTNKYKDRNDKILSVNWLQSKRIIYDSDHGVNVGFATDFEYDSEVILVNFSELPSNRVTRGKVFADFDSNYPIKCNSSTPLRPVEKKKLNGILGVMKTGQIPRIFHGYYHSLEEVLIDDDDDDDYSDCDDEIEEE